MEAEGGEEKEEKQRDNWKKKEILGERREEKSNGEF